MSLEECALALSSEQKRLLKQFEHARRVMLTAWLDVTKSCDFDAVLADEMDVTSFAMTGIYRLTKEAR